MANRCWEWKVRQLNLPILYSCTVVLFSFLDSSYLNKIPLVDELCYSYLADFSLYRLLCSLKKNPRYSYLFPLWSIFWGGYYQRHIQGKSQIETIIENQDHKKENTQMAISKFNTMSSLLNFKFDLCLLVAVSKINS